MDRRVIPAGALLAGLSFFFPYIKSPSIFGQSATATGAQLGGWAWAVPLTASVILLGYVLWDSPQSRDVARRLMAGGSLVGLSLLLFGVFELMRDRLLGASAWDIGVRPAVGPFLTLAGFLLAFAGSRWLPLAMSGAPAAAPVDAVEAFGAGAVPRGPRLTDELAKYSAVVGRQLVRWGQAARELLRRMDLTGRYQRNPRRAWASAGALAAGVILYLVFLRPSPEKLGRSTALAFVSCSEAYGTEVQQAEQTLLPRLAGGFRTRGEALGAWNQELQQRRPRYLECLKVAQEGLRRSSARFEGSRLYRFFAAHNTVTRGDLDPASVEAGSQSANLLARIQALRAPAPSESDVRQQLIGRRVDGWSFDEPSEFGVLRLSDARVQGDTLRLRANAELIDHVSQEAYVAVLELRYHAAEDGEWLLAGVEPVLVAPGAAGFLTDGAVFLTGRWRWPQNYALYNADGTWSGRWDNGQEVSGRWRIVRDRLILTRGSSYFWSGRVHSWTADSMRVGDGGGDLVVRWHGPAAVNALHLAPARDAQADAEQRATINDPDGYTNVRAGPSTSSPVVTRVNQGEEVSLVPSTTDWWRLRTARGDTGYIHRSRVRLVP